MTAAQTVQTTARREASRWAGDRVDEVGGVTGGRVPSGAGEATSSARTRCDCGGHLAKDRDYDEFVPVTELVCFACSRRYTTAGVEIRRAPTAEDRERAEDAVAQRRETIASQSRHASPERYGKRGERARDGIRRMSSEQVAAYIDGERTGTREPVRA